jgi:hypothetical protein
MDKWSQRLAKNKTDLMPKNASCKRWDTPITGHHARLGTWLLARLYQGGHLRSLCFRRLQGATPTPPGIRVRTRRFPGPLHGPELIKATSESPGGEQPVVDRRGHVRGPSMPPGPEARRRCLAHHPLPRLRFVSLGTVSGGAYVELDESFPAHPDPLGQESVPLSGLSAFGLCLHHF